MKRTLLSFLLIAFCAAAFAQDVITVKGVVRDYTNQPMPGTTVTEKGTSNSVMAASNGSYQIKVKSNATLVFSFLGSKTAELRVNNRTILDVKLEDDQNNLNEVVVLGYGQGVKRKDLTGAISSVSGAELAKVPVQNVAQALQGRIAGMQVTMPSGDPGAQPSIKIRGGSSITQSNEPLYVVDGVPQTDGLNFIDPMDIESVDILKDASATALYGARGANGVVLITTKQIKGGKTTVSYDGYVGLKKITNTIPVMDGYEYSLYAYENSLRNPALLAKFTSTFGSYDSLQLRYANRGINWQDEIFGKSVVNQYHKFSISGGGNEIRYNLFYSRNLSDGVMKNSGANKDILKLTLTNNIGKKATVNGIINYSLQDIYGSGGTQEGGNARLSMLQTLLQYRPINGIQDNDLDLLEYDVDPLDDENNRAFQSPLTTIRTRLRDQKIKTFNASATLRYNFLDHLTYNGLVSYNSQTNKIKAFNGAESITAIRLGGPSGNITDNLSSRLSFNNIVSYNNVFSKVHKLDISLGQEYIYNYSEGFSAAASNFPVVNNSWDNLGLGTVAGFPSSNAQDDKLLSFFARANYAYKDKYILTASLRADGSSKFGDENRWGYFPSAAFAWRIVHEPFMKQLSAFSDLKLRLSYGTAGNNRIANYAALGTFNSGYYPLINTVVPAAFQTNLPNPFLKWEAVKSANIGVDIGLLKQRISLTTELYDNRSKDLLYETRIPASSGFTKQIQNIGTTSSRGLEFTLNTVNIRNQNFSWNTNFNIGFNKTKVIRLSDGEKSLLSNSYTTTQDYILQVGQPVGIMYGYRQDGLYQVSDFDYNAATQMYTLKPGVTSDAVVVQPGHIKFKDISGPDGVPDGVINTNDRVAIGNANPKYTGGINNTFSYKGIDLSIFLNFAVGNDIYNANVMNNLTRSGDFNNSLAFQANRWKTINAAGQLVTDPAELIALNQGKNTIASVNGNASGRLYDSIIEDGSFLRINNVSLGYTFPKKWLSAVKVSNARIYFTAYNLHVFTRYSGYDPEVSVINNALTPGVDFSAYPRGKSFVAGLNLSL